MLCHCPAMRCRCSALQSYAAAASCPPTPSRGVALRCRCYPSPSFALALPHNALLLLCHALPTKQCHSRANHRLAPPSLRFSIPLRRQNLRCRCWSKHYQALPSRREPMPRCRCSQPSFAVALNRLALLSHRFAYRALLLLLPAKLCVRCCCCALFRAVMRCNTVAMPCCRR